MAKSNQRPPKATKGQLLQVRVEDDEKAAFEEAAALNGLAVSAWVRQCLRKAAIAALAELGREPAFLPPGKAKKD